VAGRSLSKDLAELLQVVPGWRLEPSTTPGASPLWCFVSNGKIEFSVTVDDSELVLYVMDTDQEFRFPSRETLVAWLVEHRPDTMQDARPRTEGKERVRKFFEWN
jgi:hypothetical protein